MKLVAATIHNFRGIIEQTISIQDYVLLVGANNSGKSTIIDAIRAFYEKDGFKYKADNDFPFSGVVDSESWIELHFQLTETESNSLATEYQTPEKLLKVRKYFQTSKKLHDGKTAAGAILGYKTDGTISDEPFYGAKNVQSGKFGDLIYIPAVSKVDEHAKLSGPSALRDLLTNIMADVVDGSDAYQNLTQSVNEFSNGVRTKETADKRSLAGFETDLNNMLTSWQTKFKLKFSSPSTAEIIKSMLGWEIKDDFHEKAQSIEYFGSGFQRHFIYSLIQLGALYVPRKSTKKTKDFTPSLNLILFEEPEAFLHPPQQEELCRHLVSISETADWQSISATHSSHFVSRNTERIPSIIRLQRIKGIVNSFQIKTDDWNKIVDANHAINLIADKYPKLKNKMHEDDLKPEMESVKYFLWLNPDRASIFFANTVLLVEGPSETALVNKLLDDGKLTLPQGTYILDCLGKYNMHRFMNLLGAFGVRHAVIHDDDNNENEHQELNQLIADSKIDGFTIGIKRIGKNLETLLSIPSSKAPHRKPQHILYCYTSNSIKPDKIKAFCDLVVSCFPDTEGVQEMPETDAVSIKA
jgi:putative ATP-dependent endonuclease of the OLD family